MEVYVRLIASSETFSPDEIFNRLGVRGDNYWCTGELRRGTLLREKDNGLAFNSTAAKDSDLDSHIRSFADLLAGSELKFGDFSRIPGCAVHISCSIYFRDIPPLSFDSDLVGWMEAIGASLDIDLYPLSNAGA